MQHICNAIEKKRAAKAFELLKSGAGIGEVTDAMMGAPNRWKSLIADIESEITNAQMDVMAKGGTGNDKEADARLSAFRTALKHIKHHAAQ